MPKKYHITTAIAYPNSKPHLGHALEIIQADAAARFNRLLKKEVFFQTGTDEHGITNWQAAQKQGKEIMEFLNANVDVFKKLYKKLNISYDYFIRTSDKKIHYPAAKKLWQALAKSGDIYKKKYKGMYCTGCESFKTAKELENNKCPNHPTKNIEIVEEENYFFRLSKYKDEIAKKIKSEEYKVIPEQRKNEILSFLKNAEDISFSRPKTTLPWGIPVPEDEEHVMYVWCDALSNYITSIGYGSDEKKFKQIWPADIHFIGKDIIRFHAALWPAMLISAKIALPKKLFVHGFILSKGLKMSKSTGNVIEPFEQIERYGVDPFRFYLIGSMPLGADGDYYEESLKERMNSELVGNLSNFCYRVMSFTNKNFGSKIKDVDDDKIIKELNDKFNSIRKSYEELDFKKAIDETMSVSALGNKYFQDNEPWKLIKEDKDKAHKILGLCVNIAKNLSIFLEPVMPEFSAKLQKQLKLKNLTWSDLNFSLKNHKIGTANMLFSKVNKDEANAKQKEFTLNLKVAEIKEVKNHPNAEKLYLLKIDLGEERQIVSGIRNDYSPDELKGKRIIVVSNLKPAIIRGEKSEGMLLAAESKGKVNVLEAETKPGTQVLPEGHNSASETEVKIDDVLNAKIHVKKGIAYAEEKKLIAGKKDVTCKIDGKVR